MLAFLFLASLAAHEGPSPSEHLNIVAVGDVLLHGSLQRHASQHPDGFSSLWSPVAPLIEDADMAYANFEGPAAPGLMVGGRETADPGHVWDNRVYTSYPMFNYPPAAAMALATSGFDVVSTANNHALDRGAAGVDRTLDTMEAAGLATTGTRRQLEPVESSGAVVVEREGWRVAWMACTFSTNGLPDRHQQVRPCDPVQPLLDEIRRLRGNPAIDAVMITPHAGVEYVHKPLAADRTRALAFLDAGATAVLGAHPHVLQPFELHCTPDGRQGLVVHSMGNFVSGQFHRQATQASVLVQLTLARGVDGKAHLIQAGHVPLRMVRDAKGPRVEPATPDSWVGRHAEGLLGPAHEKWLAPSGSMDCRGQTLGRGDGVGDGSNPRSSS
jgi:hypothetical protein